MEIKEIMEDKEDQGDKELVSAGSTVPFLAQRVITQTTAKRRST